MAMGLGRRRGEREGAYSVVAKSGRNIISWIRHDFWFLTGEEINTVLCTWEVVR